LYFWLTFAREFEWNLELEVAGGDAMPFMENDAAFAVARIRGNNHRQCVGTVQNNNTRNTDDETRRDSARFDTIKWTGRSHDPRLESQLLKNHRPIEAIQSGTATSRVENTGQNLELRTAKMDGASAKVEWRLKPSERALKKWMLKKFPGDMTRDRSEPWGD
jgi:hypothetical protein